MNKHLETLGADDRLLSPAQLADLAGVSVSTLRRLIASGELPAGKVRRLLRVRISDWQNYLAAHRIDGRGRPAERQPLRAIGGRSAIGAPPTN